MTDTNNSASDITGSNEPPAVFSIQKTRTGWTSSRRGFLASAAGAASLAGCESETKPVPLPPIPMVAQPMQEAVGDPVEVACHQYDAHDSTITRQNVSPDGQFIATVDANGNVKIWAAFHGAHVQSLSPHVPGAAHMAFSSDNRWLAVVAEDGQVVFWDLKADKHHSQKLDGEPIIKNIRLAAAPTGKTEPPLILLTAEGDVRIAYPNRAGSVPFAAKQVAAICVGKQGKTLATASENGRIEVWDLSRIDGTPTTHFDASHVFGVTQVVMDDAGEMICVGDRSGAVAVYDMKSHQVRRLLRDGEAAVTGLSLNSAGNQLTTFHADATSRIWPISTQVLVPARIVGETKATSIAWSDDETLFVGRIEGGVQRCTITDEGPAFRAVHPTVHRLVKLIGGQPENSVIGVDAVGGVWRMSTSGAAPRRMSAQWGRPETPTSIAAQTGLLAMASEASPILVWDREEAVDAGQVGVPGEAARQLEIGPDGRQIFSVDGSGKLRIWLWPQPEALANWKQTPSIVSCVTSSPDGQAFAAADDGGRVTIWSVSTGAVATVIETNCPDIECMSFTRDSRLLLIGEGDQGLGIWSVDGSRIDRLDVDGRRIVQFAISPNGRGIAAIDSGNGVRIWHVPSVKPLAVNNWSGQQTSIGPGVVALSSGHAAGVWDAESKEVHCFVDFEINYEEVEGYEVKREFVGRVVTYRIVKTTKIPAGGTKITGKRKRPKPPPPPSNNSGGSSRGSRGTSRGSCRYWYPN